MEKIKVKLYNPDVYFAYWQALRPQHRTSEESWNEVEAKAEETYGTRIFQTYEAFRTALHYYIKNNPIPNYLDYDQSLLTNFGYWTHYYHLRQSTTSNESAYLLLESKIVTTYGINIYHTYETFEKAMQRYIKNRKNLEEKGLIKLNIKRQ